MIDTLSRIEDFPTIMARSGISHGSIDSLQEGVEFLIFQSLHFLARRYMKIIDYSGLERWFETFVYVCVKDRYPGGKFALVQALIVLESLLVILNRVGLLESVIFLHRVLDDRPNIVEIREDIIRKSNEEIRILFTQLRLSLLKKVYLFYILLFESKHPPSERLVFEIHKIPCIQIEAEKRLYKVLVAIVSDGIRGEVHFEYWVRIMVLVSLLPTLSLVCTSLYQTMQSGKNRQEFKEMQPNSGMLRI